MKAKNTRMLSLALPAFAIVVAAGWALAGNDDAPLKLTPVSSSQTAAGNSNLLVYAVNKTVSAFPTNEDLSTPEIAYATVNRLWASGDKGFWRRISAPDLAKRMPVETGTRKMSRNAVTEMLNSEILEVRIYSNRFAAVIAKAPSSKKTIIDLRCFERITNRWLTGC